MSEQGIPASVSDFLSRHIDSVVQLEVLLLLQSHRDRAYIATELATELRIDPAGAAEQLAKLCNDGILSCSNNPPQYRYEPKTPEMESAVAELARAYADRRVTVISLIYSKPVDKIKIFADAFRFRKDKGDAR